MKPEGPGRLFELPSRRLLASVRAGAPVMLSPGAGDTVRFATTGAAGAARVLRLEPARGGLRLEGRHHAGALLCWRAGERVMGAIDTPIEAYLRGVLPGEVPAAWPLEAQKALAVAARSYTQASRGKHAAEGFDVCDGTHCQMYLGRVPGAARSELAVRQTRGLVAQFKGAPILAFYSADCGGRTANNEDVPFSDNPTEPLPYLRSVVDTPWPGAPHYCARSPHHHWTRLMTAEQIETRLNEDSATAVGTLRELRIAVMDSSGRARTIEVAGMEGVNTETLRHGATEEEKRRRGEEEKVGSAAISSSPLPLFSSSTGQTPARPSSEAAAAPTAQPAVRQLAGYAFRRAVGTRRLKSTRFTLARLENGQGQQRGDGSSSPALFRFTGTGYGHGVGLCQIGARGMASPPYRRTFRQILGHYYRGITIAPFRPTSPPP